jgi:hypothetical protein
MISRALIFLLSTTAMLRAADFNDLVLQQVRSMPQGGGYATTTSAHTALRSAARIDSGAVRLQPAKAMPSYCSGATYLVFLKTLGAAQRGGKAPLTPETWELLLPEPMADGQGIWGRWNANGPGTARLFHEAGLGRNFTEFSEAKPGDFMKIFWTDAVGSNERGHSVVYLGTEMVDGVENVRFWSSNKPGGYGEKSVARSKIARALFSRLEHPERLATVILPKNDAYLASLLSRKSSFREAMEMSGVSK